MTDAEKKRAEKKRVEASRKEAEEIVKAWGDEKHRPDRLVPLIATALHARDQEILGLTLRLEKEFAYAAQCEGVVKLDVPRYQEEIGRLSVLVELLTEALKKIQDSPGSGPGLQIAMDALRSPSLSPLLEHRRLEREVIEAARSSYDVTVGMVSPLTEALDALDAQGKEKAQ